MTGRTCIRPKCKNSKGVVAAAFLGLIVSFRLRLAVSATHGHQILLHESGTLIFFLNRTDLDLFAVCCNRREGRSMGSRAAPRRLVIQNENLDLYNKKTALDGNAKSSKLNAEKSSGIALGNRKALNDITNKKPIHREESSLKNKNVAKVEEFNEAEEMFLHDHKKCIEERQRAFDAFSLDLVLPGHDSKSIDEYPDAKLAKTGLSSPCCYSEPEELSMSEFSGWLECSAGWVSPPCSPISWDFNPLSPFAWEFEEVEYVLKQEADLECDI